MRCSASPPYDRAMGYLFKEEPANYSFDAFVKDGKTTWTGVKNPVAQKHLRSVRKGDLVFYYHTGNEKAVVGIARATSDAYPDPDVKIGSAHVVDLAPVKKLPHPVTLAAIKADPRFKDFALVRISRLSVMPVNEEQWEWIVEMAKKQA
jgi:predicted RNA-binding protein with PUA-like domain